MRLIGDRRLIGSFAAGHRPIIRDVVRLRPLAPPSSPKRRSAWADRGARVLAGLGLLLLVVAAPAMRDGAGFGFDFACYYDAAARFVAGEGLYLARTLEGPFIHGGPGTYVYAPPLAVALAPFTLWSFPDATMVWFAARVALLALAIALMPVRATIRFATFGLMALSASLLSDLALGNVNVLLLLGVVCGWRWLDRPVGAVALAVTMAVRPQLAVIVAWWLLRRRWRLVAWATAGGAAVLVATLPLVGIGAYTDFLRLLRNIQIAGAPHNASLDALARGAGLAEPLAAAAFLAGVMAALGAVLASRRLDTEAAYVVVTSASLLLTPLLWPHYLVVLALPAAFLAERGRPWGLALPLLTWLPLPALPFTALLAILAPFIVPRRPETEASLAERPDHGRGERQPVADLRP